MIFHVASVTVLFLDHVAQAPTAPVPWSRWPVQTLVQVLISVIPVAGGVWIALQSFRATEKKDREHWIRDQKMAEWKDLIQIAAEFNRIMPLGQAGSATVDGLRLEVLPLCDRISDLVSKVLFVAPILSVHQIDSELHKIMSDTDSAIGCVEIFPQSSQTDKVKLGTPMDNAMAIRQRLQGFHAKLVSLARADLSLD